MLAFRPLHSAFSFRASLRRPALHALAAGVLAAAGALALPNRYRSEARILSDTGHSGGGSSLRTGVWAPTAPPEVAGNREEGPTIIYADILKSRRLAEQLLLRTYKYRCRSWRWGPEQALRGTLLEYLGAASVDRALGPLKALLVVQRDLKSGLLTISAETRSPGLSQQVVQRAVAGLKEILVELSQAPGVDKARFTADRLREVQAKYRELETGFQRFQDGNRNWETSMVPNLRFQGNQLKGDLELWRQVVVNLTLSHEQALLEAQNDTQTLLLMDTGNLPVEKSSPARAFIVFAAMCAAGAGSWVTLNRATLRASLTAKEYP